MARVQRRAGWFDAEMNQRIPEERSVEDTLRIDLEIQYTRVMSYMVPPKEWGGAFRDHLDYDRIVVGRSEFERWLQDNGASLQRRYLLNTGRTNSLKHWTLSDQRWKGLQIPTDPFISCGKRHVALRRACFQLKVPYWMMLRWKLALVLDHLVLRKYMEVFFACGGDFEGLEKPARNLVVPLEPWDMQKPVVAQPSLPSPKPIRYDKPTPRTNVWGLFKL